VKIRINVLFLLGFIGVSSVLFCSCKNNKQKLMAYERNNSREEIAMNMIDDRLPMLKALHAEAPASDRVTQMMLYGQFIGSWDGRILSESFHVDSNGEVIFDEAGGRHETTLEVHFGWALQGRAIQDVWIAPSRYPKKTTAPDQMYGTTLRVYDPQTDRWDITFIDPVTKQSYHRMTGHKVGNDIVQEYRSKEGKLSQWNFTEITNNSFHWMWRESMDNGKTWKIPAEFFLHRRVAVSL
jgi:hypothetical protein